MLDQAEVVVTNTTPLISLVAAGDLSGLYRRNTWAASGPSFQSECHRFNWNFVKSKISGLSHINV